MKHMILFATLSCALALVGCKNPNNKPKGGGAGSKAGGAEVVVQLSSSDQMKYDKTAITVAKGSTVKLTFQHKGKLKKSAMGHNFVLLKQGVDAQKFAMAALEAKDSGYIPAAKKGDIIAHTKLLGGGESDTITFAAPAPGTYTYICTFPGHAALMKGTFTVK